MYDNMIFKKIRDLLGGKIRYFISGGAPLSQEVMNFIKVVFSAPMV